ncbi:MAG: addiction module protein [Burkholderiales bacterium]
MKQSVTRLAEQAAKLSQDERVQLVETILKHLPAPDPEWTAAWMSEIEKRIASIERGEEQSIPAEAVHARLREKYRV